MSVRFQFAGDKNISAGRTSGSALFAPVGPVGPVDGQYMYTVYGVTYPPGQGGQEVYVVQMDVYFPIQIWDIDYYWSAGEQAAVPDPVGGHNIQYKPYGTYLTGDGNPATQTPVEVPAESENYYDSQYVSEHAAFSDGLGSYYWTADGVAYYPYGTLIYVNYGTGEQFFWDGVGGYFISYLE